MQNCPRASLKGVTPPAAFPFTPWLVAVPLPVPALDFAVPHGWAGGIPLGCRVLVPWRGELTVGLVVGAGNPVSAHRVREVVTVLDSPESPWVPAATATGIGGWAADAQLPAGLVWGDLLGVGWDAAYDHRVRAVKDADLSAFGRKVPGLAWADAAAFAPNLLDAIREQGLLEEAFRLTPKMRGVVQARALDDVPQASRLTTLLRAEPWAQADASVRLETWLEAAAPPDPAALTPKQAGAWGWLNANGPVRSLSEWAQATGVGVGVLNGVTARGGTRAVLREREAPPAWHWLAAHEPQSSLSGWAKGAGVSAAAVTALLNAGAAAYVPELAPPPDAWTWLQEHGPVDSLTAWANGASLAGVHLTPTAAGTLAARGWAETVQQPAPPPLLPGPTPAAPPTAPDPDRLPEAPVWRLHGGRPASRARTLAPRIGRLLTQGRGVLVLAPDHATLRRNWELLSGLAEAAGTRAIQISGQLSEVQRAHSWALIGSGEARLVIGSYLALTAPLVDPALIVVLEEGSDAYKLQAGSRAFVPDVAARVAAAHDAALALVGAAPAAESVPYVGAVLPPPRARVHVVDYANPPQQAELGPLSGTHLTPADLGYPLSHDLVRLLRQVQERGRQAALLAPRRGYSALLRCPTCEHVPQCRNCDVPLRFHQDTRQLTCHQCGYHEAIPERCDNCGERMWQARGPGTEWIAQMVEKLVPGLKVYRMDRDRQDDLTPLYAGESGVVVGTQLLLSSDAPPNLALLGLTLADTWLNVSDFRASERYHRLLRQLAEWHPDRAPLLVVQTFQADHPALKVLVEGRDALAYPAAEERVRKELGYPPHARLAQVEIAARDPEKARIAAQAVADALHGAGATAQEVLGPAASPVARLRGVYPYHLFLRARDDARLAQLLATIDRSVKARVRVDVNPRGGL